MSEFDPYPPPEPRRDGATFPGQRLREMRNHNMSIVETNFENLTRGLSNHLSKEGDRG